MHDHETRDSNLVEFWVRKDVARWVAGVLAGIFAGVVSAAFAVVLAKLSGWDPLFPLKLPAVPILGPQATEFGMNVQVILVGMGAYLGLSAFLGFAYAHFTGTNSLGALTGMGLTWAAFSWVFLYNLYIPAFRTFFVAMPPAGASFFVCLVFGLALTSVAFFDRMVRGASR